jgi:hypothetical protein
MAFKLHWFRSVAARFFHGSQIEDDREEELRSHIQHRADGVVVASLLLGNWPRGFQRNARCRLIL